MVFLEAVPLSALPPVVPAFWDHRAKKGSSFLGTSQWACAPADSGREPREELQGVGWRRTSAGPGVHPQPGKLVLTASTDGAFSRDSS